MNYYSTGCWSSFTLINPWLDRWTTLLSLEHILKPFVFRFFRGFPILREALGILRSCRWLQLSDQQTPWYEAENGSTLRIGSLCRVFRGRCEQIVQSCRVNSSLSSWWVWILRISTADLQIGWFGRSSIKTYENCKWADPLGYPALQPVAPIKLVLPTAVPTPILKMIIDSTWVAGMSPCLWNRNVRTVRNCVILLKC